MRLRFSVWLLLVFVLAVSACQRSPAPTAPEPLDTGSLAPAAKKGVIPGRYIVVFKEQRVGDVPGRALGLAKEHNGKLRHVYRHALEGFAVELSEKEAARLAKRAEVAWVEPDHEVTIAQVPTGVRRIFADANPAIGIDGVDDARVDADVAVLDTGIADHPDLNVVSRVDCSQTIWGIFWAGCFDGEGNDGNGHGTHVAGTIGAIDGGGVVGVAPGARLHAVKVLADNGSGSLSGVVGGIDWVVARGDVEVINMSLSCVCESQSMDAAIDNAVAAGVTFAVAAGNDGADAASNSPANHPSSGVITVSALADFDGQPGGTGGETCRADEDDTLANFSNYGTVVEMAAPGVCILSSWYDGGYATVSGTSMASPHVAGAAALLAASGVSSPAAIRSTLIAEGNFGWSDESGDGVLEPLLDVGDAGVFAPATVPGGGGGEPPPPPPPSDDPPTATISNPSEGEVMPSDNTSDPNPDQIRVIAMDTEDADGTLTVEVSVGGGSWLTTAYSGGFYRRDFDWTTLPNGDVTVDARATDSFGNVTDAATVTAVVDNGEPPPPADDPPSAAITNPSDGASVTGVVTIRIQATDGEDPDGTLTVEARIGSGGTYGPAAWNAATSRYELTWDTSGEADGAAVALDARATDGGANSVDAATVTVTVDHPDPPPPPDDPVSMHVAGLAGASVNEGRTWHGVVTVTVHDDQGGAVAGATVSGTWSGGSPSSVECTTDAAGTCSVESGSVRKNVSTLTFNVDDVSGPLPYAPGDDAAQSLTVSK